MPFASTRRERPDPSTRDLRDGTVTRVAQQAKDPERVNVEIDGAFAFGLSMALAVEAGLRKGLALSAERQRSLLVAEEGHAARAAALGALAQRAHTTDELRRKLGDRGFDPAVVEDTLARVAEMGMLDDAAYAEAYARGRFAGRGHGPSRIRQDLRQRGVSAEHIEAALAALDEAEDVSGRATHDAAQRWASLVSEPDARKRKKKTLDFLLRRGHSFDVARAAVDAAAEADPADDAAGWDD